MSTLRPCYSQDSTHEQHLTPPALHDETLPPPASVAVVDFGMPRCSRAQFVCGLVGSCCPWSVHASTQQTELVNLYDGAASSYDALDGGILADTLGLGACGARRWVYAGGVSSKLGSARASTCLCTRLHASPL